MAIFIMKSAELEGPHQYRIGDVTHGSAHLPSNTLIRIEYENTTPFRKTFLGTAEYLY